VRLALTLVAGVGAAAAQETRAAAVGRTLEQEAAFAAEYERDFAKATRLLDDALAEARRTAAETDPKVRHLVATRRRYARAAGIADADRETRPIDGLLLVYRAWFLDAVPSDDGGVHRIGELAPRAGLLGAPFVPWLEDALLNGFMTFAEEDGSVSRVRPAPHVVAAGLAAIEGPEADAALTRAARSNHPGVRAAAVAALDPARHRRLIEDAAKSPVPSLRSAAAAALQKASPGDDWVVPYLVKAAADHDTAAARWLARHRRPEALAAFVDAAVDDAFRSAMRQSLNVVSFEELADLAATAPVDPPEAADGFLKLASMVPHSAVVELPSAVAAALDQWSLRYVEALRARAGAGELQPDVRSFPDLSQSLGRVGGVRAAAAAEGLAAELPIRSYGSESLRTAAALIMQRIPVDRLPEMSRILAAAPPSAFVQDLTPRFESATPWPSLGWFSNNKGVISPELAAATLDDLRGVAREWFLRRIVMPRLARDFGGATQRADVVGGAFAASHSLALALAELPESAGQASAARVAFDVLSLRPSRDLVAKSVEAASDEALARFARAYPEDVREAVAASALRAPTAAAFDRLRALAPTDAAEVFGALMRELPPSSAVPNLVISGAAVPGAAMASALLAAASTPAVFGDARSMTAILVRFARDLHPEAIDLVRRSLTHSDHQVREAAQTAFEAFKKNREALEELEQWTRGVETKQAAVEELLKLLEHPKRDVVLGAVRALGGLKAKAALPKLVALLARDDADLSAAVNEAIARIGA